IADGIRSDIGNQFSACRGSVLISDDAQAVLLSGGVQNGFDEVPAATGKYPTDPKNEVIAFALQDGLFAAKLTGTVNRQWVGGVRFEICRSFTAIKYIIG